MDNKQKIKDIYNKVNKVIVAFNPYRYHLGDPGHKTKIILDGVELKCNMWKGDHFDHTVLCSCNTETYVNNIRHIMNLLQEISTDLSEINLEENKQITTEEVVNEARKIMNSILDSFSK